jgi:hypothetical protein
MIEVFACERKYKEEPKSMQNEDFRMQNESQYTSKLKSKKSNKNSESALILHSYFFILHLVSFCICVILHSNTFAFAANQNVGHRMGRVARFV